MLIHAGCILLHTWTYFYCVIRLMQSWVLPHGYADYWCGWRNHDMIWKAINSILLMVWTSLSLSTIYTRILAPSTGSSLSSFFLPISCKSYSAWSESLSHTNSLLWDLFITNCFCLLDLESYHLITDSFIASFPRSHSAFCCLQYTLQVTKYKDLFPCSWLMTSSPPPP